MIKKSQKIKASVPYPCEMGPSSEKIFPENFILKTRPYSLYGRLYPFLLFLGKMDLDMKVQLHNSVGEHSLIEQYKKGLS